MQFDSKKRAALLGGSAAASVGGILGLLVVVLDLPSSIPFLAKYLDNSLIVGVSIFVAGILGFITALAPIVILDEGCGCVVLVVFLMAGGAWIVAIGPAIVYLMFPAIKGIIAFGIPFGVVGAAAAFIIRKS